MIKVLRPQRGQTVVEFAFMLPLLVLFLIGIIDFSILFYDKAVVTNASREGARQGSIFRSNSTTGAYMPLDSTGIQGAVNSYLTNNVATFGSTNTIVRTYWSTTAPPSAYSWGTENDNSNATSGGAIKVRVEFAYTFLALPRLAGWGNPATLIAETIMRME